MLELHSLNQNRTNYSQLMSFKQRQELPKLPEVQKPLWARAADYVSENPTQTLLGALTIGASVLAAYSLGKTIVADRVLKTALDSRLRKIFDLQGEKYSRGRVFISEPKNGLGAYVERFECSLYLRYLNKYFKGTRAKIDGSIIKECQDKQQAVLKIASENVRTSQEVEQANKIARLAKTKVAKSILDESFDYYKKKVAQGACEGEEKLCRQISAKSRKVNLENIALENELNKMSSWQADYLNAIIDYNKAMFKIVESVEPPASKSEAGTQNRMINAIANLADMDIKFSVSGIWRFLDDMGIIN